MAERENVASGPTHPGRLSSNILGKVLVVDDDSAVGAALVRTLAANGYEGTFAANAAEALDALDARRV